MQALASVPRDVGQVVPPVQRDEDGARPSRPPLGGGQAVGGRPVLPRVRRVQGRAGVPRVLHHLPDRQTRRLFEQHGLGRQVIPRQQVVSSALSAFLQGVLV